ncbi:MAG: glucan biosynthesis protein G [Pseudomonadota bacterium]
MNRRAFLAALGAASLGLPARAEGDAILAATGPEIPATRAALVERAATLATMPYRPAPQVPKRWRDLDFDEYRKIWFDGRNALWTGTDAPLRVDAFAPGLYFPRPVRIYEIESDIAREVGFRLDAFDRADTFPDVPVDETLGYSGLRMRAELEAPGIFTEFLVAQGASYFRAIATGQIYGISARGIAVNTAEARGEEFPDFTEFWLERPAAGSETFRLHATLDGPSVAGLYSFDVTPGRPLRMRVEADIFPRRDLRHVGLAPLTSMFQFDATNRDRHSDFRPAVHDSDGLLMDNGYGETIWRPLANPERLEVSAFMDENPRGFGLMQRSRDFSDFADLEALYHRRPGLWIAPEGDWGKGSVTLIEIPTEREIYDNIVAYWRPSGGLPAGRPHRFAYTMTWGASPEPASPRARIIDTKIGGRWEGGYIVAIDFAPGPTLPEDLTQLERLIRSSTGTVSEGIIQHNPETGGPRLNFSFDPEGARLVEFRADLRQGERVQSEVWLYRWTAP